MSLKIVATFVKKAFSYTQRLIYRTKIRTRPYNCSQCRYFEVAIFYGAFLRKGKCILKLLHLEILRIRNNFIRVVSIIVSSSDSNNK